MDSNNPLGVAHRDEGDNRISVVIPVFNEAAFIPLSVPSVLSVLREHGRGELIVVDNGSTDDSHEVLLREVGEAGTVLRLKRTTVAAARNYGARHATGRYLGFLDADCVVPAGYFARALSVLRETGAAATGGFYRLPADAGWIAETWHALHARVEGAYVETLFGSNFFIARDVFEEVGGFDEGLISGEEPELCQRLISRGYRLYESPELAPVHLRNPKTVKEFWRQQVWHGLGMLGTVRGPGLDRPTLALAAHVVLVVSAGALGLAGWLEPLAWLTAAAILILTVPVASVLYRSARAGRVHSPAAAIALYTLYYFARLAALGRIVTRRAESYRGTRA